MQLEVDPMEIIWHQEPSVDFLADLKAFARSLDYYEVTFDLDEQPGKHVLIEGGSYTLTSERTLGEFECPDCAAASFDVLEGEFEGKAALGLLCRSCFSYGALFPAGL